MRATDGGAPCQNGDGRIFRLDGSERAAVAACAKEPARGDYVAPQWDAYFARLVPGDIDALAIQLGVSVASLVGLGVRRDLERGAWAFPMRDESWNICGARLRLATGKKLSVRGSRAGIFAVHPWRGRKPERLVVVEGASDAAAAYDAGVYAIGRHAAKCHRSDAAVATEAKRLGVDVVIVPDRGKVGVDGANACAERCLARGVRAVVTEPPPAKDVRDWMLRAWKDWPQVFLDFIGEAK